MRVHRWLFGMLGTLVCLSVAVGDKTSQLEPGTYVVQRQQGIEYAAADEPAKTHTMQAFLPQNVKRRVPGVVIIRGSEAESEAGNVSENATWLASHGYAVFVPEYRSGRGRRAAYRDVRTAVRFVRAHCERFGTDPNRIGVWGCADGGMLAAVLGVMHDQLPELRKKEQAKQSKPKARAKDARDTNKDEETTSARVQAVLVTAKASPLKPWMKEHLSFDDPPFLLLLASDQEEASRLEAPKPFQEANVECTAYKLPAESPCRALGAVVTVDGEESPVWRLVLGFADEHLKQAPLNLAVELERVIVRRVAAQDWVLGTQSMVDLRALLQFAAHRIGREPTPQEMKVAREHAKEFADAVVRVAAAGGGAPRITRVVLAKALSRLSPQWPFTTRNRPAAVPPVSRRRLRAQESEE